jgi:pSer/pThr/pTyr-binding forkhead associated (FHA) protein
MEKRTFRASLVLLAMSLILSVNAWAEDVLINDILINPAQFWNLEVTLVGDVQTVNADPAGTTRGTYALLDDSCPTAITIRTKDLPPVGRSFRVTGVVLQVADLGNVPVIKESKRVDAGEFSNSTRNLLIGLGAVLLILIIVFVILLLKPKKNPSSPSKQAATAKPGTKTEAAKGNDAIPTVAIPMPAPAGDETQLLPTPLAELLVEQGNDKGAVFTVGNSTTAIGRSGARHNGIVLTDNTVSKAQATLRFDPARGRLAIVDDGAKNPTKVNGVIAGQPVLLNGGELIEMGKTALRFKML